ncbi:hypothetical protein TH53_00525 [Pedobacter lusitanus]|uniref:Uncharacterized protein n=1 Tax=Pedobacter lusitanus TaxID=1503925 RepID=A0A0D0GX26_9SPHI|nr:hypothetical protein [Pedobacter lusitanus]KIO79001.1 hypothetical protein TH53_00525 [Pedobacter lusitanus]
MNTGKSADRTYEMLHEVFEGKPERAAIKKLMTEINDQVQHLRNLNWCGSTLLSMKKSSAIGVTEMQILKHM